MPEQVAEKMPVDLPEHTPVKPPVLPAAALRALAEAEQRRQAGAVPLPPELGGRNGPEPVRYDDWENKGLAVDF